MEYPNVPAPQLPSKTRTVYAYVPPSLVENSTPREVNLLYLYDGQTLTFMQTLLDSLFIFGQIPEMLIIGIPSDENRVYELTPTECVTDTTCYFPQNCSLYKNTGGFPKLLDFMISRVQPLVLTNLSVTTTPIRTGSGGFSLGGLSACEAIYRTSTITRGYCGSPSLWWNCAEYSRTRVTYPKDGVLYLDSGSGEEVIDESSNVAFAALSKISGFSVDGNLWHVHQDGDFHEMASWVQRLPKALATIFT